MYLKIKTKKHSIGFTLLELLLAISLFCIISVAIYSSMAVGIKIHKRGGNLTGKYNDVSFAFERIGQDLRSAISINNIYFSGSEQDMSFYAIQAISGGQKELSKITYLLEKEKSCYDFLRLRESYPDSLQASHAKGDVLLDSVSELNFNYGFFKKQASGDQILQWKSEWKDEGVPRMVRIRFSIKGESFEDIVYCPAGKMAQEKQ
jgi:prepilin-type N-terminal cleavage/methylation domain-containing protein